MFFRKKKAPEPPPEPVPGPQAASPADATTQFLTGDGNVDRMSVQVLLDAIAKVTESRDLESLLSYIVDTSTKVTGAERGLLVLLEEGELNVRVGRTSSQKPVGDDVRFSTSVVRKVLEGQEALRTTVQSDSEAMELGMSVFDLKLRAVMCVPIQTRRDGDEEVIQGVLYVDSRAASREFSREDLSLFAALAQHISIALLNARLHQTSIEKAQLDRSLEIASEIQTGLMPQVPEDVAGFDLFGWFRPAENTSGDFYDFVKTRDGRWAVVVGDVTGHGIGPALITATAQASLRSYLRVVHEPSAIMTMLNQDLDERMDDGMFLTLFMALLGADGEVHTINAGATPPLVWRAADGSIDTIELDDPALGMISDHEYSEGKQLKLEPGDVMLAFTDGFVEARKKSKPDDLFDEKGVREVIERLAPEGASAKELVEALVKSALDFSGGEREDDMTVVAVRREG